MKISKGVLGLKVASFIMVIVMLMSIPVIAFATTEHIFEYEESETVEGAIVITGVDGDFTVDPTLFIPPSIDGKNVVAIADSAFSGMTDLVAVEIPASVKDVGAFAFEGCTGITEIAFMGELDSVGEGAFTDTYWFQSFPIDYVFVNKQNVILIGYIGSDEHLNIPINVEKISEGAFKGNEGIKSVIIPPRTVNIEAEAFAGCSNLSEVTAYGEMEYVGPNAFDGTKWYNEYPGDFIVFGSLLIKYNGSDEVAIVPNFITKISPNAFTGSKDTKIVRVPVSVSEIGEDAFYIFSDAVNRHYAEFYCYENSFAEQYANENDLVYFTLASPGDMDNDKEITASDARRVLRIAAKLDRDITDDVRITADASGDGEVRADDARILLRLAAKLESYTNMDLLTKPSSSFEVLHAYTEAVKQAVALGAGYTRKASQEFTDWNLNSLTVTCLTFMNNRNHVDKPKRAKDQVFEPDTLLAADSLVLPTLLSTKNIQTASCVINEEGKYEITIVMGRELDVPAGSTDTAKMFPVLNRQAFDKMISNRVWYKDRNTNFNYNITYYDSKVVAVVDVNSRDFDSIEMQMNYFFDIWGQIFLTKIRDKTINGDRSGGDAKRVDKVSYTNFIY